MTLPFDPEHEQTIREYAASLTTDSLLLEIIDQMDRAIEINNSGAFRVASLLIGEFETRKDCQPLTEFRKMIDFAIAQTHKAK
jgi:hypothetical protein